MGVYRGNELVSAPKKFPLLGPFLDGNLPLQKWKNFQKSFEQQLTPPSFIWFFWKISRYLKVFHPSAPRAEGKNTFKNLVYLDPACEWCCVILHPDTQCVRPGQKCFCTRLWRMRTNIEIYSYNLFFGNINCYTKNTIFFDWGIF